MGERITADQFQALGVPTMSGPEVLKLFEFDPEKCVIEVDEEGSLLISQPGSSFSHGCAPGMWRRV